MVTIDISFRLRGSEIPSDHGYTLLSAISRLVPSLHDDTTVGIHPITGVPVGERMMRITEGSRLVLRMDSSKVNTVMVLAGKQLDIDGHGLMVGLPSPSILRPAVALRSRLVVIKGYIEVEPFLEACRRQMADMEVRGNATVPARRSPEPFEHGVGHQSPYIRRTVEIHGRTIVGYAVEVHDLTGQDSLKLQEKGLGGRRRFGCGIFVPKGGDTDR